MNIQKARIYFAQLLKSNWALMNKGTGLMLGIRPTEKAHLFKLSYDIENEGAFFGNSPVGARIVMEKTALRAIQQFPKKIEKVSMKVYLKMP